MVFIFRMDLEKQTNNRSDSHSWIELSMGRIYIPSSLNYLKREYLWYAIKIIKKKRAIDCLFFVGFSKYPYVDKKYLVFESIILLWTYQ